MKTKDSINQSRNWIMLILANLLVLALIGCQLLNFPEDVVLADLTLEEAQKLVTFSICVPAYIPSEIDQQPNVVYHDSGLGAEPEKYIRLKYYFKKSKDLAFEVSQRKAFSGLFQREYSEEQLASIHESAVVIMLDWLSPRSLSISKLNSAKEKVDIQTALFQTKDTVWLFAEMIGPSKYRANMTRWSKNTVEYMIISILPSDEIKKITISMFDCKNQ